MINKKRFTLFDSEKPGSLEQILVRSDNDEANISNTEDDHPENDLAFARNWPLVNAVHVTEFVFLILNIL